MENHGSYEKQLKARIEEWDARIEQLKAKAKTVEAQNKRQYEKKIGEILELQKDAHDRFDQLKNASDEAWEDVRQGVETSYSNLKKSFETAVSRFN